MRRQFTMIAIASTTMLFSGTLATASTLTAIVDSHLANSVVFQNFNGATDPATSTNNTTFSSIGNGIATYNSNGNTSDPQITFGSAKNPTIDTSSFPNFRMRYSVTNPADPTQVWRNPATAGQMISFNAPANLAERQGTIPNPNGATPGYRVDPVTGGTTWSYQVDYIYADRGMTLGSEFDHAGDFGGMDGRTWTANANAGPATVAGGTISGTTSGLDPQLYSNGASINPSTYQWLEVRMSVSDAGTNTYQSQLFFANTLGNYSEANSVRFDIIDDGAFHTYLVHLTDDANWATGGNVTNVRFDMINNPNQATNWSIDSIRFYQTVLLPTPAALPAGLGLLGMLAIRRRRNN